MKKVFSLVLLLGIFFMFVSCSDKEDPKPDTISDNGPKGMLRMHLHTYIDETEVDGYNINYTNSDGRKISLSIAQFYLSNFQLVKLDGSIVDVADAKILKTLDEQTYTIGNVPVGNYKSIKFHVGLNSSDNKKTPSSESSDILNNPEMWLGNEAQPDGYVFFNLEGKIDTTSDASADISKMQPFKYRIGTDANYKEVSMPVNKYTVSPDQTTYVHMYADCNRIFNGIKLSDANNLTVNSLSDNNSALAQKIVNNLPSIFIYE